MDKKCECCGVDFVAQRKTARFCSSKCRIKNHRPSYRSLILSMQSLNEGLQKMVDDDTWLIDELIACALEPDGTKRLARLVQLKAI